ncbi:MAG TPA: hypothetical protein VK163_01225 [Opitutaceae bacterium]|nr:hypothetical protein [Opitutaceae bacterium]
MRVKDTLEAISGVAAGKPALTTLETGRRYFGVKYLATANSTAQGNPAITNAADIVDTLEMRVGKKLIRHVTADFLIRRAKFTGITPPNNIIPIYFGEPERIEQLDEEILAWEMFGVSDFAIRTTFKDGILTPALSGVCSYDGIPSTITDGPDKGKTIRRIMFQEPGFWNASGGVYNITDIRTAGRSLHRIFFDGVDVTRIEVLADGVKVFDRTKADNDAELADYELDGSQFKFALVFDEHGQVFNALKVARNVLVKVYSQAGGALSAVIETLASDYSGAPV